MNDEIPPVEKLVQRLQAKEDADINLGLRLGGKTTPIFFDATKPTFSGGTKENQEGFGAEPD